MIQNKNVILASGSPRRKELLSAAGIKFTVKVKDIDESYPDHLHPEEVALYLAQKKSAAYDEEVKNGNFVITADTVVCINDLILNKAQNIKEATEMLQMLSGKSHKVITGVCLRGPDVNESFKSTTEVAFKKLTDAEIRYYIENCQPFDKAGAYGIQEWIGITGIEKINGSYFNVVGLPVKELYEKLVFHNIISVS